MDCKKALTTVSLSTRLGSVEVECSLLDQCMLEPSQQVNIQINMHCNECSVLTSNLMVTLANKFPNHHTCKNMFVALTTQWLPGCMPHCGIQPGNYCVYKTIMMCILTTGILHPNNFCKNHYSNSNISTTCSSEPNKQHALRSVCVQNLVQMNLGHPVTLVWTSLNHPVLLAWQQVSVGDSIECFDYRGTPISIRSLVVAMCMCNVRI